MKMVLFILYQFHLNFRTKEPLMETMKNGQIIHQE